MNMIKVEYCPIMGCTNWEFRSPTEEVDQRERKSKYQKKRKNKH